MSHYTVAVISRTGTEEEVAKLLAPYDENLEVEPYIYKTKAELIEEKKEYQKELFNKFKEGIDSETLKRILKPENAEYFYKIFSAITDEDFYKIATERFLPEEFDADGNILTTYNPNSKWDWYEIGGRWSSSLRDKRFHDWVDTVQICDWQWDACDEDHYQFTNTYAVIMPDGNWDAPGTMGWWGMSSETDEEYEEWVRDYKAMFHDMADPDWYITIVDCHI